MASPEGLISPPVCRVCQHLAQFLYLALQPRYFLCGQGSDSFFDPVQLLSILGIFGFPPSMVEALPKLSKAFRGFLEGLPAGCPAKQASNSVTTSLRIFSGPNSRDTTITEIPKMATAMSPGTESNLGSFGDSG